MKKYSIDLNSKDIEYLTGMFGDAQSYLDKQSMELCRRLADMGVVKAKELFMSAEYDGDRDVKVESKPISNGYAVTANGESVLFIEFGAGVHYPADHPEPNGFSHGTYGKLKGKNDYWFYTGMPGNAGGELAYGRTNTTITHGNKVNKPMYDTVKYLEGELERMVKEVFDLYQ